MSNTRFWVLVKDGLVVNSVIWDGESNWLPPEGYQLIETTNMDPAPCPKWTYANGVFTEPSPSPEPPAE